GFIICLSLGSSILAQEVMRNSDVVGLVQSGLDAEIIIAKIRAGIPAFDTSATALKELAESGVPKSVIVVMIEEAGKVAKSSKAAVAEDARLLNSIPEQGKLSDMLSRSRIYIATEDLKARDIIAREIGKIKRFSVV